MPVTYRVRPKIALRPKGLISPASMIQSARISRGTKTPIVQ
jgi:hypothetical protein